MAYDRLEDVQKKAEALGCAIDFATSNTLQLDLDSEEAYKRFLEQASLMFDHSLLPQDTCFVARPSKSGNIHVTVILPGTTEWTENKRIMMQALLGSDLKREALNLSRWNLSSPAAILLFRPVNETVAMPSYFQQSNIDFLNELFTGVWYI